jgi:hypothetical protein
MTTNRRSGQCVVDHYPHRYIPDPHAEPSLMADIIPELYEVPRSRWRSVAAWVVLGLIGWFAAWGLYDVLRTVAGYWRGW